ncbi:zinc ribbon domain-containing protein [Mammaliicoccus fleurettii]|uniref:zinc ribbon domain-containing protein n=1 Tax=Mammaliicoccus fleurettii TaxID=150056 RepID=UPI0009926DB3|nr:zinc ribbon domain-containing protein [Mammaliicoccus fleurettii]OOV77429.1 hypothetical protein B2G86_05520 [Mammaliicoccus fleurettii]
MNCPKCGSPVTQDDRFCGECGEKLVQSDGSVTTAAPNNSSEKVEKFKSSLNTYKNDTLNESKGFFKNIFTRIDEEVTSQHAYSYKFIASLVGAGVLLLLIFLLIIVPADLGIWGPSKSSIIFSILIPTVVCLAVLFGITFGIIKILNIDSSVHKVLSDFVSFNLFSTVVFFIGLLFMTIKVPTFATILIFLSILLFAISPIYLMTKYSNQNNLRMPVVYGILIYFIITAIIIRILVERSISSSLEMIDSILTDY